MLKNFVTLSFSTFQQNKEKKRLRPCGQRIFDGGNISKIGISFYTLTFIVLKEEIRRPQIFTCHIGTVYEKIIFLWPQIQIKRLLK